MNANFWHKNMVVLGNPHSPHISVWLNAAKHVNVSVEKIAIHHGTHAPMSEKNFHVLFSKHLPVLFPKSLKYCLGGIYIFFKYFFKSNQVIHAHCASGYGLMAFLSKKKYALTTYGSEIFNKDRKSFFYNLIMSIVLKRAFLISASSMAMEDYLVDRYQVDRSKIRTFSLGVSSEFLKPAVPGKLPGDIVSFLKQNKYIFFSNRRMTAHYNILYIIQEFETLLSVSPLLADQCGLLLLSGDYEPEFFEKIACYIDVHKLQDNIMVITDYIDKDMMSSILENTTATISMAATDQLSAAILESIAKNVPPVLNRLDAYGDIEKNQCGIFLNAMETGALANCLNDIVCKKFDQSIYQNMKTYVSSFLEKKRIHEKIIHMYHELLDENLDMQK
ncbi:MAG: glycosyltransferase [Desulfotignum sp.]|jgi:hypothetical protein|nr:glycosyltransferase [Desulfotignum sp.]